MGSAISSSEKLADNEFLKRFVGLEPITDNDPFWNQLLSFNFKPPKSRFFKFCVWIFQCSIQVSGLMRNISKKLPSTCWNHFGTIRKRLEISLRLSGCFWGGRMSWKLRYSAKSKEKIILNTFLSLIIVAKFSFGKQRMLWSSCASAANTLQKNCPRRSSFGFSVKTFCSQMVC